ncbi:hypothetical protein BGZ83_002457 [Gryganskiella cystojenkinii]|nr:hypothetical protein BGZ83_002457 [Gryganskiella cystojenkinii]
MNKGVPGLVAYGDSDSEESDNETSNIARTTSSHSSASERPQLQDTISARTVVAGTRPSANDSLGKIATTNLLKQGIEAQTSNNSASSDQDMEERQSRSLSGTPLPADHSAAAEIMNTPTMGRSPKTMESGGHSIDEERDDDDGDQSSTHGGRSALMRSLLRPKPIPGVESFGIPPEPDGEADEDVQIKIEGFQRVKEQRGIHFNQSLMKNKNFRNPHIYASLVEFVALNEFGSNFEKSEFFDFEGYGPESYAAGLAEAQKMAAERLAQQQQNFARSHLPFVPGQALTVGGSGSGAGGSSNLHSRIPQAPAVGSAASNSSAGGLQQRARRSKWDAPSADDPNSKRARH